MEKIICTLGTFCTLEALFEILVLHIFSPRPSLPKPAASARPHRAQLSNAPLLEPKDPRVLELRHFRDFGVWANTGFFRFSVNLPEHLTIPAAPPHQNKSTPSPVLLGVLPQHISRQNAAESKSLPPVEATFSPPDFWPLGNIIPEKKDEKVRGGDGGAERL